jgi:predicted O-methyltransferase YrrM
VLANPQRTLKAALQKGNAGEVDAGMRILNELVANDPFFLEARGHRAWWRYCRADYEGAVEDLLIIVQMSPRDDGALAQLGDCHARCARAQEATGFYMQALNLNPGNTQALTGLFNLAVPAKPTLDDECDPAIAQTRRLVRHRFPNAVLEELEKSREALGSTAIKAEIGALLYALVRMLKPAIVAETGVFVGFSSLWIAQALQDNAHGHLHSADLFPQVAFRSSYAGEGCADSFLIASAHLQAAGLMPRVTLHKGDSAETLARLVSDGVQPALVYIDGDHSVAGCWRDFAAVQDHLDVGAVVVLHDTHPHNAGVEGPYHLLTRLHESPFRETWEIVNLPTADGFGVGIVQKLADCVPLGPPRRIHRIGEKLIRRIMSLPLPPFEDNSRK